MWQNGRPDGYGDCGENPLIKLYSIEIIKDFAITTGPPDAQ